MDEELYGSDTQKDIVKCLTCEKDFCNNCLARGGRDTVWKHSRPVALLDPETKEMVAYFPSTSEAARSAGINKHRAARYCSNNIQTLGYIWTYHTQEGDRT